MSLRATLYTDPACPWAYSATPWITTLRWRYRDQIEWSLVTIGLREDTSGLVAAGYDTARQAVSSRNFRERFGMPFAAAPRARLVATGRSCRAIVATRNAYPGREFAAARALAFAWFNTPLLLDEDVAIEAALSGVAGIDAAAVVAALEAPETIEAYERDKARARSAAGGATEFQGRAAVSDGRVRFTAPSIVFESGSGSLEVGGFQPLEAYDVAIANLDTLAGAGRCARGSRGAARVLPRGPLHPGGRGDDGGQPRRGGPARGGGSPDPPAGRRPRDARGARRRRDLAAGAGVGARSRPQFTEGSSGMRARRA